MWAVRHIVWCLNCASREENGRGAELCARCQAQIQLELEEAPMNRSWGWGT